MAGNRRPVTPESAGQRVQARTSDYAGGYVPFSSTPPSTQFVDGRAPTLATLAPIPDLEEVIDEMQQEVIALRRDVRILEAENTVMREYRVYPILKEMDALRAENKKLVEENQEVGWRNRKNEKEIKKTVKELEIQGVGMGREIEEVKEMLGGKTAECLRKDRKLGDIRALLAQKDREIAKLKAGGSYSV